MRIAVIGGAGFIGTPLVRRLVEGGHQLLTIQRRLRDQLPRSVRQIACDQLELRRVAVEARAFRPDVVVDLVSSSASQAAATVDVYCGYAGRLVAISSQDVYRAFGVFNGTEPGPVEPPPITEESPRRTSRETYPAALLARLRQSRGWVTEDYNNAEMEDVVMNARGLPGTVLRLPMVYGPGDYLHRFYPIIKSIDDGQAVIPIADRVAQWRGPRGYVENVAAAIQLAADRPHAIGAVFNVGEEESLSELEWTEAVCAAAGAPTRVVVVPFEQAPAHLQLPGNFDQQATTSTQRIRERLGYREPVSREDALRETIAWERANPPDGQGAASPRASAAHPKD